GGAGGSATGRERQGASALAGVTRRGGTSSRSPLSSRPSSVSSLLTTVGVTPTRAGRTGRGSRACSTGSARRSAAPPALGEAVAGRAAGVGLTRFSGRAGFGGGVVGLGAGLPGAEGRGGAVDARGRGGGMADGLRAGGGGGGALRDGPRTSSAPTSFRSIVPVSSAASRAISMRSYMISLRAS